MAKVTFKAKGSILHLSDTVKTIEYKIPKLTRNHCDMGAFRNHKYFGSYANSDLFLNIVNKIVNKEYPTGRIRESAVGANTSIEKGYLSTITIDIPENMDLRGNLVDITGAIV